MPLKSQKETNRHFHLYFFLYPDKAKGLAERLAPFNDIWQVSELGKVLQRTKRKRIKKPVNPPKPSIQQPGNREKHRVLTTDLVVTLSWGLYKSTLAHLRCLCMFL